MDYKSFLRQKAKEMDSRQKPDKFTKEYLALRDERIKPKSEPQIEYQDAFSRPDPFSLNPILPSARAPKNDPRNYFPFVSPENYHPDHDGMVFAQQMHKINRLPASDRADLLTFAENFYEEYPKKGESTAAMQRLMEKGYGMRDLMAMGDTWRRNINQGKMEGVQTKAVEKTKEHPFLANVGAAAQSMVGGAAGVAQYAADTLFNAAMGSPYKGTDPNLEAYRPLVYAGTVRGKTQEDIEKKHGKFASLLYSGATSTADTLARTAVAGPAGGLALAGLGSAADTARDVSFRGGNALQTAILATGAGILEWATEKFSVENLEGIKNAMKNLDSRFLRDVTKGALIQAGIEPTEETVGFFGNLVLDTIVMGDESQFNQAMDAAKADGKTGIGAAMAAWDGLANELADTIISSAAAGFFGGEISGVTGHALGNAEGVATMNQISPEMKQKFIDAVRENENSKGQRYAQRLTDKGVTGENITGRQGLKLYKKTRGEDIDLHSENVASDATTDEAAPSETAVEKKPAAPADEYISAVLSTQVSGKTVEKIITDDAKREALEKATGVKISGTKSQMRNAAKEAIKLYQSRTETAEAPVAEAAPAVAPTTDITAAAAEVATSEEGRKAFVDGYNGQDMNSYKKAFNAFEVYGKAAAESNNPQFGFEGASESMSSYRQILGDKVARQAWADGYGAGPSVQTAMRPSRRGTGTFTDKTTGVKKDGYTQLTDTLKRFAKKTGIDVELVDSMEKGGAKANGRFLVDTMTIQLSADSDNVVAALGHETAEFLEAYNPKAYAEVRDQILSWWANHESANSIDDVVKTYQRVYQEAGQTDKSWNDAMDEAVNDALGAMLTTDEGLDSLVKWVNTESGMTGAQKQTFFRKVGDMIRKAIEGLKQILENSTLTSYQRRFLKMEMAEQQKILDKFLNAVDNTSSAVADPAVLKADQEAINAFGGDLGKVAKNDSGELLTAENKQGNTIVYSLATYKDGGEEKLVQALRENGHTQEEIRSVTEYLDTTGELLQQIAESTEYGKLKDNLDAVITTDIKNGKQVLSALVKNGEYPVNFDLALICKKRVAYMKMMSRLISDGVFNQVNYSGEAIAAVNEILRENGFETACLGCFVESRRLQLQAWAETIASEWNHEVEKLNKKAGYFGFAKHGTSQFTADDIAELDKQIQEGGPKNKKDNLNLEKGAVRTKMRKLLKKVPKLRYKLRVEDLLTPEGLAALRSMDGNLFSLVKQRYGAASPKIVQNYTPYNGEIADLTFKFISEFTGEGVTGARKWVEAEKERMGGTPEKYEGETKASYDRRKAKFNRKAELEGFKKYLFDIGGIRIQSFSDFMIENVFDYLQIVADLAAKGYPMHGYTKEAVCLRLFGMCGIKWNGSLIAHTDPSLGSENAGLVKVEDGDYGLAFTDENGQKWGIAFDDYEHSTKSDSFIQSIGFKDVVALNLDPRYSGNVGNITIGLSDKQIKFMMRSPLFRMIIPYHASGIIPGYAKLLGIDVYNDYTPYQNTTVKQYYDLNGKPVEKYAGYKPKEIKVNLGFDYNEAVQRLGDARAAADEYVEWCHQAHPVYGPKGVLLGSATFSPKFSDSKEGTDFTKEPGYYKVLIDFDTYNSITGASSNQNAVRMQFPSEDNRMSPQEMEAYKQRLRETGIFTEAEIEKYAKKANMTFAEIVEAEARGRAAYDKAQDPKFDATVKAVEQKLLAEHPRTEADLKPEKGKIAVRPDIYDSGKLTAGDGRIAHSLSVSDEELDRTYMAAVNSGDMETAQKMVDQTAKDAGYLVEAFHGTRGNFYVFDVGDTGFHFGTEAQAKDRERFKAKAGWKKDDPWRMIHGYLKIKNPLLIEEDLGSWDPARIIDRLLEEHEDGYMDEVFTGEQYQIGVDEYVDEAGYLKAMKKLGGSGYGNQYKSNMAYALRDFLKRKGFDGIQYENHYEAASDDYEDDYDDFDYLSGDTGYKEGFEYSYIAFDPEQIKLADPVTYDDSGNVVPLSERFKETSPDIRYSLSVDSQNAADESEKEISEIRQQLSGLEDDIYFAEGKELRDLVAKRSKLEFRLDKLINAERRVSKRTSPKAIIENLRKYRRSDLESIAEQISDGAWDYDDYTPRAALEEGIRDILEGRGLSAIEMQNPKNGAYVRDVSGWEDRYSLSVDGDPTIDEEDQSVFHADTEAREAYSEQETQVAELEEKVVKAAKKALKVPDKQSFTMGQLVGMMEQGKRDARAAARAEQKAEAKLAKAKAADSRAADHMAERYEEKVAALRQKAKDADLAGQMFQGRLQGKRVATLAGRLKEAQNAVEWLKQQVKDSYTAGEIEQGKRMSAQLRRLADELAGQKKRLRDYKESRNERDAVAKYRKKVEDLVKDLSKLMRTNTDKLHVPEAMKGAVTALLDSLNMASKTLLYGGDPTKKDTRYAAAMLEVHDALAKANKLSEDGSPMYVDLPSEFLDQLREHIRAVNQAVADAAGVDGSVATMTSAQLADLAHILGVVKHSIIEANKLFTGANNMTPAKLARETIQEAEYAGEAKAKESDWFHRFAFWQNTTPYYAFKRMGKGAMEIFHGFQKGLDKLAANITALNAFKDSTFTDKQAKEWGSEIHTIELASGEEITLTTAQIMSLYCLSKRPLALQHILKGGISVGDIEVKRKGRKHTITQQRNVNLTEGDLADIFGLLNDEQLSTAIKIQNFMQDQGGKWGNEISMRRFGYRAFGEEDYFPIASDPTNLASISPDASGTGIFRLLNMSATKPVNKKASNAVMVYNIFDVFGNHMADMAKYNAFALPTLDAIKWFNYVQREDSGKDDGSFTTWSVRRSLQRAYGKGASEYVMKFLKDINGVKDFGREDSIVGKFTSTYKVAAVGANLRVALLQPTAYVRAYAVMKPTYLARALKMSPTKGAKEMLQYSGIAQWKALGFYDTNINRGLADQMSGKGSAIDTIKDKSMAAAELGDQLTWGALWNACKLEMRETKKLDGDALMQATADRFAEVVYATQVVDSPLTRSQLMRSDSQYMKLATAFMSEPTLSYSMAVSAASDYKRAKAKKSKALLAKARPALVRAITAYTASAAVSALAEAIFDALRDDDDYEKFLHKFTSKLGEDFLDDLNPVDKIPIVRDMISALMGDTPDRMEVSMFADIRNAYDIWAETIRLATGKQDEPTKATYYGNMTLYGKVSKTLKALSEASGIPVSAATREVITMWNNSIGALYPDMKVRTYWPGEEKNILQAVEDGHLAMDLGQQLLIEKAGMDADKAYWAAKKAATGQTKTGEMEEAIAAGDVEWARETVREQIAHGSDQSKALNTAASVITKAYSSGSIDHDTAEKLLRDVAGKDEDDIFWRLREADEGGEEFDKYEDFNEAISSGKEITATVRWYLDHGSSKESLASRITSEFKPRYLDATPAERNAMKRNILNAYVALGYDRDKKSKDIDRWLKQKRPDSPEKPGIDWLD